MAEAFLNKYGKDRFEAESAGLEPGSMNPAVVKVMQESGIDLSGKGTQGVTGLLRTGRKYDSVITVCDAANAEKCPVFPGVQKRIAWSFADPSAFEGDQEQVLQHIRKVRDEIEKAVLAFIKDGSEAGYRT
jgi:arsenate reductase